MYTDLNSAVSRHMGKDSCADVPQDARLDPSAF